MSKGREVATPSTKRPYKSFQTNLKEICVCCKKEWHELENCYRFKRLELPEKKKFVYRQRLCFRCLEPITEDHIGKTCKTPKTCDECKKDHPTSLHEERVVSNYINNKGDDMIGLCIVPVKIHHKDDHRK